VPTHLLGPIDVPEIDNDRTRHQITQALEIETTKLLPFGYDNERIGGFRAVIGVLAKGHILQHALSLIHACRIENAHPGTHVL